ncbi:hypothetical protein EVAR_4935_1 [Eumeta japonica]|uniref:Uncharacterized protein n=1 Tax=Eumeta variegata TaxID=151549 RepID=A0A4C1UZM7_EUMVA|nr:hypothetical protein EVAR_4935_1 [Eumeta japonica]
MESDVDHRYEKEHQGYAMEYKINGQRNQLGNLVLTDLRRNIRARFPDGGQRFLVNEAHKLFCLRFERRYRVLIQKASLDANSVAFQDGP